MSSAKSITVLVNRLQDGDRAAVQKLWEHYFHRLVCLARKKLGDLPRRAAGEEDVALSAFDSFCRAAEQGRFPHLTDRDDLWQWLVLITVRKASDLREHERRDKRDRRRLHQAAGWGKEDGDPDTALAELLSREPAPAFAAELAEECQLLLDALRDEDLRQIALWKMEGYTNEEIAGQLGCALSTVERRLRLIRKRWQKDLPDEPS